MGSASVQLILHADHSLSSQLISQGVNPSINIPTEIKAQLKQESVHGPHGVRRRHLECLVWVIREAGPLDPTGDLLYIRPTIYQGQEMEQLYLIHRNKYREVAKMRKQRNMSPMTEQNKTLEKALNKMETSNVLDEEFKTLIIRMLNEVTGRVSENGELQQRGRKHKIRDRKHKKEPVVTEEYIN